jgi:hypothetical protein
MHANPPHNLKVVGSNPAPAPNFQELCLVRNWSALRGRSTIRPAMSTCEPREDRSMPMLRPADPQGTPVTATFFLPSSSTALSYILGDDCDSFSILENLLIRRYRVDCHTFIKRVAFLTRIDHLHMSDGRSFNAMLIDLVLRGASPYLNCTAKFLPFLCQNKSTSAPA